MSTLDDQPNMDPSNEDYENVNNNDNGEVIDEGEEEDPVMKMIKKPPSYEHYLEELDIYDAILVPLDDTVLKEDDEDYYPSYVNFWYDCLLKSNLCWFSDPGDEREVDGGMLSVEGKLLDKFPDGHIHATKAISIYNGLTKTRELELELEKLLKVNKVPSYDFVYYMTFYAINKENGLSRIYQAALSCPFHADPFLVLFKDWSNDKILAIMTITGGEKDLAARKGVVGYDLACSLGRKGVQLLRESNSIE